MYEQARGLANLRSALIQNQMVGEDRSIIDAMAV